MPLGVRLTRYRLLVTGVTLGITVPKAVYSYKGQSLIPTTLDLVGVILGIILFWIGDTKSPESFPWFFEDDLIPPILRFLYRPEACAMYARLLSASPSLICQTLLWAIVDCLIGHKDAGNVPAYVKKGGLAMFVLASSTAICISCLQCVMAIWPKDFEGLGSGTLPAMIKSEMWLAYGVKGFVTIASRQKELPPSIASVALHNLISMGPFIPLSGSKQPLYTREGDFFVWAFCDLMMLVFLPAELYIIGVFEFPDLPGAVYGGLLCCVVITHSFRFFASIPISSVPSESFANIWSASKAAYDRVRSAGNNAWAYVSGIGCEV